MAPNRNRNIQRLLIAVIIGSCIISLAVSLWIALKGKGGRMDLLGAGVLILASGVVAGVSVALVRKFVVQPLNQLTDSVTKANHVGSTLFGTEREDEIGDLSREIRDMMGSMR
ncbi:MAG: hypothetical protein LBH09_04705, partial [Peptococcaceae bacterium]|nr:hypothetical protein [Peptococcaceae bacterium]